jgi:hypothetical protein
LLIENNNFGDLGVPSNESDCPMNSLPTKRLIHLKENSMIVRTTKITLRSLSALAVMITVMTLSSAVRADVVTNWNLITQQALLNGSTSPVISSRSLAIVQVSVFDALNGIERRYEPIHADMEAPRGASRRAAVVQAAYANLIRLFPTQLAYLDAQREASLAAISSGRAAENSVSIARGIEWGQAVADDIYFWRSADGITPAPPPFMGGLGVGEWRPTPSAFLPGAAPQWAHMTPWAIDAPAQFRPSGPPALTSAQYAADYNEVAAIGSATSMTRTADQTEIARFMNGNTPAFWNRFAIAVSDQRNLTLSQNARLLALMNVAMADAVIACWEAKYYYTFWRPITAIRLGSTDGNPNTTEDAAWTPLLTTPNHPDYPSGHATVSPSAGTVLKSFFGNAVDVNMTSESTPGVVRSYTSVDQGIEEAFNARIYGGIHFRSACLAGNATGTQIGELVLDRVARSVIPVSAIPAAQY